MDTRPDTNVPKCCPASWMRLRVTFGTPHSKLPPHRDYNHSLKTETIHQELKLVQLYFGTQAPVDWCQVVYERAPKIAETKIPYLFGISNDIDIQNYSNSTPIGRHECTTVRQIGLLQARRTHFLNPKNQSQKIAICSMSWYHFICRSW